MAAMRSTTGAGVVGGLLALAVLGTAGPAGAAAGSTTTPIKHLVVIYQENVSFDHYFGTYPSAANTSGQPFTPAAGTPSVNGLGNSPGAGGTGTLLTNNPNKDSGGNQVNPRRLDPANINDVLICDQDHNYNHEQQAFDGGAMDKFVTTVGTGSSRTNPEGQPCDAKTVMHYYDGNATTGLWNYAQHFAMSDNSFNTTFGPSTPGAVNLASGNTGGVGQRINGADTNGDTVSDGAGGFSLIEDAQPYFDDCSTRDAASLTGQNVGDLLNAKGVSWGFFQGGFRPTTSFASANAAKSNHPTSTFTPDEFKGTYGAQGLCNASHPVGPSVGGTGSGSTNYGTKLDYIAHHEPFQYYASTANPHHLQQTDLTKIGTDTQSFSGGTPQFDTANHQYDMSDFDSLVSGIAHGSIPADHLPAVSFLKASGYQDGHAAYSDPIDEQQFITREINALEQTPDWSSTAVVINYDDSDGFYDHAYSGIHNTSDTSGVSNPPGPQDFLTGTGKCGDTTTQPPLAGQSGRCGYGPRVPLLVISPYAKANFVDHTLTDTSSILRFAEDNWGLGRIPGSFDAIAGSLTNLFDFANGGSNPVVFLDPATGQVSASPTPNLPEVSVPIALVLTGSGLGLGALLLAQRRRRAATLRT